MTLSLAAFLSKARNAAVPLVAITTPDQPATLEDIKAAVAESGPLFAWSAFLGLCPLNEKASRALAGGMLEGMKPEAVVKPEMALKGAMSKLPAPGVLVMLNAQPFLGAEIVRAGLLAIRDRFKADNRVLVLLGQSLDLPAEIREDFERFSVPLPTEAEVARILTEDVGIELAAEQQAQACSSLIGLKAFAVEQAAAMSLDKKQLDFAALAERKAEALRAVKGLTVPKSRETYADVAGLDAFKGYLDKLFASPEKPTMVVQLDEVEKALSSTAAAGDNTGVSQETLAHLLSWLSGAAGDKLVEMCVGVPGTGKSLVTRAVAGQHGVPCAIWSLGDTKESLVGASQANMRRVTDTIDALSGGRPLILMTSNGVEGLKPELRRRIMHEWMFDLPDGDAQAGVWDIWCRKLGLDAAQPRPSADGWTGADIAKCCRTARLTGCSLIEAGRFTVPYAVAAKDALAELRASAEGKFLDANKGGPYRAPSQNDALVGKRARRRVEDN